MLLTLKAARVAKFRPSRRAFLASATVALIGLIASLMSSARIQCAWTERTSLIQNEYRLLPERANFAAWKRCAVNGPARVRM